VTQQAQVSRAADFENRRRFTILLFSRAAIITALLGSTIFFNTRPSQPHFSTSQIMLYAIVAMVYLGTAGTYFWLRWGRLNLLLHVQAQIVFDVLVAALLVYLTGGVESPFCFFFALPVIITSVFFPRRGSFLTAGLSCLFLGAVFILENQGILPVSLDGRVAATPATSRVVYLLALNYTMFFAIAWLSGTLSEQLKRTGRKLARTEIDLERLSALNQDIVQSLLSGLMVVDPSGNVSLLNPVARKILGVEQPEGSGLTVAEVFPGLVGMLDELEREGYKRTEIEHEIAGGDQQIPVGVTLSVLRSADGETAGTLVHMQDLTERKKMEESIKRAEKMAALGEMAAGMAHEIRNPLASVSGAVQVLKEDEQIGEEDRRLMGIIHRETRRLDELLSDFLAFARPKEPQKTACDLKDLVDDTVSVFVRTFQKKRPDVTTELSPVRARVDPDQLRQVLWNLLTNAAEAVSSGGKLLVKLSADSDPKESGHVILEVWDDGPAIDPGIRSRIFDPFFTTKERGSGLGLATVSRIVEAHEGSISIDCPGEEGNRFIVRLPGVING
jgi:two-component system, NtrC family, sensor histidine kinase PilS